MLHWFEQRRDEPPVFLAIGLAEREDGLLRVWSAQAGASLWDVEMSLEERVGFMREAMAKGWRLDVPFG